MAKPAKRGRVELACTPNHLIRTPNGWREAGKLKVGDHVLEALPHHLSDFQWEALRGTMMGDSCLSPTRSGHAARFRFGHCEKQTAYADWKASLFSNLGTSRHVREDGVVSYDFQPLPELTALRREVYAEQKKVFDDDYLKRLTPLSLALWYTDDGHFAIRSKGLQRRTAGLTGRATICVEAMDAGDPGTFGGVLGRHLGHPGEADLFWRRKEGTPRFCQRRNRQAARPHRSVRAPEHGLQVASGLPGPVRRRSACSDPCVTS